MTRGEKLAAGIGLGLVVLALSPDLRRWVARALEDAAKADPKGMKSLPAGRSTRRSHLRLVPAPEPVETDEPAEIEIDLSEL